jgi:hypothetical protein
MVFARENGKKSAVAALEYDAVDLVPRLLVLRFVGCRGVNYRAPIALLRES